METELMGLSLEILSKVGQPGQIRCCKDTTTLRASAHHWTPSSTSDLMTAFWRTCLAIFYLVFVCCYRGYGQEASSLANDIAWSVAHEGCDLYVGDSQRSLSELRACFVRTQ